MANNSFESFAAKWIPIWRYTPINYNYNIGIFDNITQACVFRNNIAGNRLRIRFNNLHSERSMIIDAVTISLHNRRTGISSPLYSITYQGKSCIHLEPDSSPYSDILNISVTDQDDILIYAYFAHRTEIRCICTTSSCVGWQSVHQVGNFQETDSLNYISRESLTPCLSHDIYPLHFAAGICEVSVISERQSKLIALFGDSITHMSYFSDPLLEMLCALYPGQYSVMNAGISGNRILKSNPFCPNLPGEGTQFGIAGKDRFHSDVYDGVHPDIVFIMEGINDCTHSLAFSENEIPSAYDIFDALSCIVAQAKSEGSKVYIGTVPPFGAFGETWRSYAETLRCEYNTIIRNSHIADGIVDIDAILRNPEDIHRMQDGYHLGDWVHPNWHGGVRIADALVHATL